MQRKCQNVNLDLNGVSFVMYVTMKSKLHLNPLATDVLAEALCSGDAQRYVPENPSTHPRFDARIEKLDLNQVDLMRRYVTAQMETLIAQISQKKVDRASLSKGSRERRLSKELIRLLRRDLSALWHLDVELNHHIENKMLAHSSIVAAEWGLDFESLAAIHPFFSDPLQNLHVVLTAAAWQNPGEV